MTIDAYTLTERLKNTIEDSMANVSELAHATDILKDLIDHPDLDKIIRTLERFYANNQQAWNMVCKLNIAVRGKKIKIER